MTNNVVQISLAKIDQDPELSAIPMMAKSELALLVQSIDEKAIQDPLWVRPEGDKFILVNGRNRLEAARTLRLATVPCIVKPSANPLEDALDSAFARRNLTKTGVAYTLYKVFPGIAQRAGNHDSGRFVDKGRSTGDKIPSTHDKGSSVRSLCEKYGLDHHYLISVIEVMNACRPGSNDEEQVRHMIMDEHIGHANLLKGLQGWQAYNPVGDDADPNSAKVTKKAPVDVVKGMERSFTFIRNQAFQSWDKLSPADKETVITQFARTWKLLPKELQAFAIKKGKTTDYKAAWAEEEELRKPKPLAELAARGRVAI